MAPLIISALAVLLAAIAVGVTLSRKRNHIVEGLRSELDLALEENKRLDAERKRLEDELHAAKVKAGGPDVLTAYAQKAVDYAEQLGGTKRERLQHALGAARDFDAGDNGQRDWTDTQLRVAIEAAVKLKK